MKILILDDDKICRRVNSETLRRAGYETLEASSAQEASDLLEAGEPVVLIIADISMPGVDGLEFITRLRGDSDLGVMPVLLCTAIEPSVWVERAEPLGIAGFTPKPVNANHLRGKVATALLEERWPLESIVRTQSRLDITPEGYFDCLEAFLQELDECRSRAESAESPVAPAELSAELNGLSGAARNLGAERIAEVLAREAEVFQHAATDRPLRYPAVLKREQAMLKMAVEVLKREHEEEERARISGRAAARVPVGRSRWRSAAAAKLPARAKEAAAPGAATSEPPHAADSMAHSSDSVPPANSSAADSATTPITKEAPAPPPEPPAAETPPAEAAPKSV